MADLTKIFTGMQGGPEAIQNNFEALNGQSQDNSNIYTGMEFLTSMTELNGTTINQGNQWIRKMKFKDFDLIIYNIVVTNITAKQFQNTNIAAIPSSFFDGYDKLEEYSATQWNDKDESYNGSFDLNGNFKVWPRSGDLTNDACIFVGIEIATKA